MTYSAIESSVDQGEPFFLYLFDNGTTKTRLCSDASDFSGDPDATGSNHTWTSSPIAHEAFQVTGNVEKNNIDLTFPLSDTFAQTLLDVATSITTLTIWRAHHTASGEYQAVWKGRVTGATVKERQIAVHVETVFTSLKRSGCSARTQIPCRHILYGPGCNLDINDFKASGTVSAVSGNTLTVAEAGSQPDGYYTAGIVIYNGLYGWISSHSGSTIVLVDGLTGLADDVAANGPASVYIAPGCDLSLSTCDTKFSNSLNYGGFPFMPNKNPFNLTFTG